MGLQIESLLREHYEYFDRRIREVLRVRGVTYEPNSTYYNEIFFHIYERVFNPRRLAKFNPKGSFRAWLGAVTRNEVLDWIKSRHPRLPVSRGADARNQTLADLRSTSVDAEPQNGAIPVLERLAAPAAGGDPSQEDAERRVQCALEWMNAEHRAVFELLAIAIRPVSIPTRGWLARRAATDPEQMGERLNALTANLEPDPCAANRETYLAVCHETEAVFRRRVEREERRLRDQGLDEDEIEALMTEAEEVRFLDLEAKKNNLAPGAAAGHSAVAFQIAHKRWRKWRGRKAEAMEDHEARAGFRQPSYRQIGQLVGKSESAMAGLIRRAKASFRKHLEQGEGFNGIPRMEDLEPPRRGEGIPARKGGSKGGESKP